MHSTVVLGSIHVDQQLSVGLARLGDRRCKRTVGGFFGGGGGIILVRLLVWVGLERHRAYAISPASFIIIDAACAVAHGIAGEIDVTSGSPSGWVGLDMTAQTLAAFASLISGLFAVSWASGAVW
jgi:uncharacterized membrane protein YfcA